MSWCHGHEMVQVCWRAPLIWFAHEVLPVAVVLLDQQS